MAFDVTQSAWSSRVCRGVAKWPPITRQKDYLLVTYALTGANPPGESNVVGSDDFFIPDHGHIAAVRLEIGVANAVKNNILGGFWMASTALDQFEILKDVLVINKVLSADMRNWGRKQAILPGIYVPVDDDSILTAYMLFDDVDNTVATEISVLVEYYIIKED